MLKVNSEQSVTDYFDMICLNDFLPQVTLPTRFTDNSCTLIDQILTCPPQKSGILEASKISSAVLLKRFGNSDHQPCLLAIDLQLTKIHPPKFITYRKPKENAKEQLKANFEGRNVNEKLEGSACANESYKVIIENLSEAYEETYPKKTMRFRRDRHKIKKWMTDEILDTIKEKDAVFVAKKKAKKLSPTFFEYKEKLKVLEKKIDSDIREAKQNYYKEQITENINNIKSTWKIINEILNKANIKSNFPPFFLLNEKKITDKANIANEFNKYFATIGKVLADQIKKPDISFEAYLKNKPNTILNFNPINEEDILKIIQNMESKKSSGNDNIPCFIIKDLANELAPALVTAINKSLASGVFPNLLKIAKVIPLYKNKGPNTLFENWRPISLLPALSKIYERVIYNQIYNYFTTNSLFANNQYGFRKCSSTEYAILEFQDKIKKILDARQTPFAVYLDLSKAFDTIDHSTLLHKLRFYGFSDSALKLLESYLTDRYQFIQMEDICSDTIGMEVGVPQGSILGPLLFIIYVNDIPNASQLLNAILFADDTSLFSSLTTFMVHNVANINQINGELDNIFNWLCANKLSLNVSKTKYMIFTNKNDPVPHPSEKLKINGKKLDLVQEFNFLGIMLDSKLTWEAHAKKVASKISRTLGVLSKVKNYTPACTMKTLYQTLVVPRLNYGIKAWGFAHAKLFKIQKKAVRIITNSKYNAHTDPIFKREKLLKIEDLFKISCMTLHYKIERAELNVIPIYFKTLTIRNHDIHGYATRQTELRPANTNFKSTRDCLRSFLPELILTFPDNILSQIFKVKLPTFKRLVKDYLISKYSSVCLKRPCTVCGTDLLL